MGLSVVAAYASLIVHFGIIFFLIITRYKSIEKKVSSVIFSLIISFAILFYQLIYREALISSFFPTIIMIGMYISLEDPSIRRLEVYN